jgi:hypothetical protein
MRRRLSGGASALVLAALLAVAGCGSTGHALTPTRTAAAQTTAVATTGARTAAQRPNPRASRPRDRPKASGSPAARLLASRLALASVLRRQATAAGSAASSARRAAASNPANKTCTLTLRGRPAPVACGLKRSLQQATLHDSALAGMLATVVSRSH